MTDLIRVDEQRPLDIMTLGQVLAESGYFEGVKDAAQAIVKVLAGRELGIGEIAAMTGIYIVKGRVTLSANLIASQIKRSGRYNYIIRRLDDHGCVIEFFERGQSLGNSSFTADDAKNAGLLGGENWRKFPRNMYFARAISNGARWYTPDVFSGPVYTPDELGDAIVVDLPPAPPVDTATGEVKPNGAHSDIKARIHRLMDRVKELGGVLGFDPLIDFDEMGEDELKAIGEGLRRQVNELKAAQTTDIPTEETIP